MEPVPRTRAARVSAYASTTHCSEPKEVLRSLAMSGRATFTMVTSISSMNVPRQTVTSGNHLRMSPPSVGHYPPSFVEVTDTSRRKGPIGVDFRHDPRVNGENRQAG